MIKKTETVNYKYDAAGRMVSEGDKNYAYGWLDKVMEVSDSNGVLSEYTYFNSGQLANATHNPVAGDNNAMTNETFVWDGLALIDRNGTSYINEPHAGGGNPVLAINSSNDTQAIFNDILGTSVGTVDSTNTYSPITKTTFGYQETNNTATAETNFYTGKPNVRNLGYVFLMRNYRSDLSKWQTEDPLGYPDGWNNFAYCNNQSTSSVDLYGCVTEIDSVWDALDFFRENNNPNAVCNIGQDTINLYFSSNVYENFYNVLLETAKNVSLTENSGTLNYIYKPEEWDSSSLVLGRTTIVPSGILKWESSDSSDDKIRNITVSGTLSFAVNDNWDFVAHPNDSFLNTLLREYIPNLLAQGYSLLFDSIYVDSLIIDGNYREAGDYIENQMGGTSFLIKGNFNKSINFTIQQDCE